MPWQPGGNACGQTAEQVPAAYIPPSIRSRASQVTVHDQGWQLECRVANHQLCLGTLVQQHLSLGLRAVPKRSIWCARALAGRSVWLTAPVTTTATPGVRPPERFLRTFDFSSLRP
jgi:hypothetical protein